MFVISRTSDPSFQTKQKFKGLFHNLVTISLVVTRITVSRAARNLHCLSGSIRNACHVADMSRRHVKFGKKMLKNVKIIRFDWQIVKDRQKYIGKSTNMPSIV